jgi:hypothetical protein
VHEGDGSVTVVVVFYLAGQVLVHLEESVPLGGRRGAADALAQPDSATPGADLRWRPTRGNEMELFPPGQERHRTGCDPHPRQTQRRVQERRQRVFLGPRPLQLAQQLAQRHVQLEALIESDRGGLVFGNVARDV